MSGQAQKNGGAVLVAGGNPQSLCQAAAAALPLAREVEATVEGVFLRGLPGDSEDLPDQLGGLVERLFVYSDDPGAAATGQALAAALLARVEEREPALIILGDHPFSREAAARLALRLGGSCASMCERIHVDEAGRLRAERPLYGGVASGSLLLANQPAVCVLAPASGQELALEGRPEVEERTLSPAGPHKVTLVASQTLQKTVDLAGARRVVSVGRGFARAEDIALAEELVQMLEAELGCSRPIAEDFKWLPQERLVGLTGTAVSPDLYLALGISGQVQHLAGIKGARVVAAINTDPRCPIVRNADYTVLGDLYKVLPALKEALAQGRNGG